MLYDLTESMPDQDGFGIGIITKQAMEKLVDPITYYAVRYEDKAKEQDFARQFTIRIKQRNTSKRSNTRISLIFHEADDLTAEFSLYSPIIMLLVVVIIAMVLSRMVKERERSLRY